MRLTSRQILDGVDKALEEMDRRLASGELDQSGRFYTDEELAAGAATGEVRKPVKKTEAPAA